MRKIIFLFAVFQLFSCSSDTPKCNNENIKSTAVNMLNEEIRPILINWAIEKEINYSDIRNYAWDRNLDADELIEKEKKKVIEEYDSIINLALTKTEIRNVRTQNIDEEIQKCSCSAEIYNPRFTKSIDLYYTAQKVEDSNKDYWVEIDYTINTKK